MFDAVLEVFGVDINLQQRPSGAGDDEPVTEEDNQRRQNALTRQFDEHYGIIAEMREDWHDYSVRVIPIAAEIQLFIKNEPVWSSNGIAGKLWEGDEDVRKRHVIYFPPVSPQARRRLQQKKS